MRTVLALTAAVALSGCGVPGIPGGSNTDVLGALKEIASDPRCGHTDRISGNLGGFGGNNLNVFLERTCPAPAVYPLSQLPTPGE